MKTPTWLPWLFLVVAVWSAPSDVPPNIVIFLADDLGIGDVGCFGNDTIRTPSIDGIARDGVRLTHHLAAAAICTPSRAALLTGRYPVRMGMVSHNLMRVNLFLPSSTGLPDNERTFAEMAKQKGYTTGMIGKWHLGLNCETSRDACHHPMKQGFDYFYGLPMSNSKSYAGQSVLKSRVPYMVPGLWSAVIGGTLFLLFLYRRGHINLWLFLALDLFIFSLCGYQAGILLYRKMMNGVVLRNYDVVEQPLSLERFTRRLVFEGNKFLEARRRDAAPFLLYMSWLQVHTALHSGPEFRGGSKHGAYGDEVEEMDWSVGAILSTLEALGMRENTLVYFSSDNGGHLEETGPDGSVHGGWNGIYRGGKGQGGMDGGIRMPTVAMWPGKIPAGSVVDVPTSQMDVFATVAALLHLPLPADRIIDGVDIMPLLTGASRSPPHEFLFHYCGDQLHAARYTPQGDTGKDPSETQALDVSKSPHRETVQTIVKAVEAHTASVEDVPSQFAWHRLLPRPWLQPCCGGGYFPNCKCFDEDHAHLLSSK